jgi:carbamoyl-phosphate synthase large subunit
VLTAGESVLVTGVGGGVGQSIIKALTGSGLVMVGVDADGLAAGLQAVPIAYRVPRADDRAFIATLVDLCAREQCKLIFPGLDPELPVLAAAAPSFAEAGVTVVVSEPDVIRIGDDKLETAAFLAKCGFPAPETVPYRDEIESSWLPVVLKPRWGGSRSVGVFVVKTAEQLRAARRLIDPANCVVQEYLAGDEYTCGTVNFDGQCHGPIVMRRELRGGDTYRAEVIRDEAIESHVSAVAQALRPFGACNFQLRLRAREPVIFEINPRCSGTTAARALAGFNEPLMIASHLLQRRTPEYTIRPLTILRYWAELVARPDRLADLSAGRRSTGKVRQL